MPTNNYILKGDICYSTSPKDLITLKDGFLICQDNLCKGAYENIPAEYAHFPIIDYSNHLITPGLVDLHVHAPQFSFRGLGMDRELLDWLNTYTFPEEAKYNDLAYAKEGYSYFVDSLKKGGTTHASIFATLHNEATLELMYQLEESGLHTYVGKVNMDRNSPENLIETTHDSLSDTMQWIQTSEANFTNTHPILTPRFIPTCSDELMNGLGELCKKNGIPLQSHLSENLGEIDWVKELCPWSSCYADAYDQAGTFGTASKTIMAHCVYPTKEELDLMKKNKVYVAHCPQSNTNLSSGIAPIRTYLDHNIRVGLGSDVAGGSSDSIFRAIVDAIQVSKLYWRLIDHTCAPLTSREGFYLATKGGGEFFGKVGSFESDYEFNALVLDDALLPHPQQLTVEERLERSIYLFEPNHLSHKYVGGKQIF